MPSPESRILNRILARTTFHMPLQGNALLGGHGLVKFGITRVQRCPWNVLTHTERGHGQRGRGYVASCSFSSETRLRGARQKGRGSINSAGAEYSLFVTVPVAALQPFQPPVQ
jgi:hypothetical protein